MATTHAVPMPPALSSRLLGGISVPKKTIGARNTSSFVFSPVAGSKSSKKPPAKSGRLSSARSSVSCLEDKLKRVASVDDGFASLPAELIDRGPAVALAFTYLGDAVWEVYARQHMMLRKATENAKVGTFPITTFRLPVCAYKTDTFFYLFYNQAGTKNVALRPMEATKQGWCTSIAMHGHLMRLIDGDVLSLEELAVLKWGKDFGHESRSGHKTAAHKEASALEALVAYWYLFDPPRLHFVLETLGMTLCGRPLRGLSSEEVGKSVSGAMDDLWVDDGEDGRAVSSSEAEFDSSATAGSGDVTEEAEASSGDTSGSASDEIARLKKRVTELEDELLMSKRAARLMRARK